MVYKINYYSVAAWRKEFSAMCRGQDNKIAQGWKVICVHVIKGH